MSMGKNKNKTRNVKTKTNSPERTTSPVAELLRNEETPKDIHYKSSVYTQIEEAGRVPELIGLIRAMALNGASDGDIVSAINTKFSGTITGLERQTFKKWCVFYKEIREARNMSRYAVLTDLLNDAIKCSSKADKPEDIPNILKLIEYMDDGTLKKQEQQTQTTQATTITIVNDLEGISHDT